MANGHGGYRPGGGRPKGSKNLKTKQHEAMVARLIEDGESPLEFLIRIMRDEEMALDLRMDAAKVAAPYVHQKLSAITLTGDEEKPVQVGMSLSERVAARQKLLGHAREGEAD